MSSDETRGSFLDALDEAEVVFAEYIETNGSPCARCGAVFCDGCPYI